jgi:hypothetical protein
MITSGSRHMPHGPVGKAGGRGKASGLAAAGARLPRAGCRRPRGCLRSLAWERFQGGGADSRSPMPAPGQATALPRGKTAVRAATLVPAGRPDPSSRERLPRQGGPLFPGGLGAARPAHTGRRASQALVTAGRAMAGRKPACPGADPPDRGTATTRSTRRRRKARSPAARRRGSSTVSTRWASTPSSSTRGRRVLAPRVSVPGSPAIRGTFPALTVSRARGPAVSLPLVPVPPLPTAQATRRSRALPGRPPAAGRTATRHPASSPARRDRGQALPGARRPARSLRASSRCRQGRRPPATTRRARPRPGRRSRASSSRPASSPRGRRSMEPRPRLRSLPAGPVPERLAREHQDQAASRDPGQAGPCPLTARRATHGQGRVA